MLRSKQRDHWMSPMCAPHGTGSKWLRASVFEQLTRAQLGHALHKQATIFARVLPSNYAVVPGLITLHILCTALAGGLESSWNNTHNSLQDKNLLFRFNLIPCTVRTHSRRTLQG